MGYKKIQTKRMENVADIYEMSLEEHTRKMHVAAQAITNKMTKKLRKISEKTLFFQYETPFFSTLDGEPITVEPFVPGEFMKYLNNDGLPALCEKASKKVFFEKAEALTHFSYEESKEKLLLVDLQGSGYNLYDPEIATADDLNHSSTERFFCAGNLNELAFDNFFTHHKCNIYCKLISLTEIEIEEYEVLEENESGY